MKRRVATMYNGGKILTGLVIFLILITFPVWYNVANDRAGYTPELERAAFGDNCVRDSAWMVANHMELLNSWRDQVVRENVRYEEGPDGTRHEISLSNTCLSCHPDKDKFCDKCHNYLGVDPYCWQCHIVPKEVQP